MVFNLLSGADLESDYFGSILIFFVLACLSGIGMGTFFKPVRVIMLNEKEIERLANLRFLEFVVKITKSKQAEEVMNNYKNQIEENNTT